ncbi:MAG: NfeD family protein [Planctomycetia bacterium]
MSPISWIAMLLVVGLAVMVLEVFIPSGGILGFVSVAALVAAVAAAFLQIGVTAGMVVLAITVIAAPLVLAVAFRWFPETPLGRRVLPPPPDPADVLPEADRRRRLRDLVGRGGLAVSELLPWGRIRVGDALIDAMSESGPIAAGGLVEVAGVQGLSLIVRRADRTGPAGDPVTRAVPSDAAGQEADAAGQGATQENSRLSPALESFEFEKLEPPRA